MLHEHVGATNVSYFHIQFHIPFSMLAYLEEDLFMEPK